MKQQPEMMLHFFRKIRQDLLTNSKFYRYLKYAIGEIVLVVLGILIALQINNWNEEKHNEEIANIYFDQLLQGFDTDLVFIEKLSVQLDANLTRYDAYLAKIEQPEMTIDSSLHYIEGLNWLISRVEFQATAINTLESTGDIKLIPPEIRNRLVDLKTLQEKTISDLNFTNALYGDRLSYATRFYGGGDVREANMKNQQIAKYFDESRKLNILLALQNAQESKTIGERRALRNLHKIREDMGALSSLIHAALKK